MLRALKIILSIMALVAAMFVGAVVVGPSQAFVPASTQATTDKHFITNLSGACATVAQLGYNVCDSSYHPSVVNALPTGVQAMVWLGQKCPTAIDSTFRARVDALRNNPKVLGFYLSDEPHIADCPNGPAALKTRADYIKSTSPTHKSFIVLSKVADFGPFKPANSGVDWVGLDPYPCSTQNPQCDIAKIGQRVSAALSAGIPLAAIVPVYQAFGQENTSEHYYSLPTPAQMQTMLEEWERLVPAPPMDYTYGWGHQGSANPTLVDSPALQQVFSDWFAGSSAQSC